MWQMSDVSKASKFLLRNSFRHEYNTINRTFYFSGWFKHPPVVAQCNLLVEGHRIYTDLTAQGMRSCLSSCGLSWSGLVLVVTEIMWQSGSFCLNYFPFYLVYRSSSYSLWTELSVTLEQKCGMHEQRNEMILQVLDGPIYHCRRFLITAAV